MEPSQIFNLLDFDEAILRPSVNALGESSEFHKPYAFADAVTSLFWLVFGVDGGYFSIEHANSVFAQRFSGVAEIIRGLYRTYGYVFDPAFEPQLMAALNRKVLPRRDEDASLHLDPSVLGTIRSALIVEHDLKQSRGAWRFLSLFGFHLPTLTRIVTDQGFVMDEEGRLDHQLIADGYLSTVVYMKRLVRLSATLKAEQTTAGQVCERRLRQLTRWRVNRHRDIDGPLRDVALFVNQKVFEGAYSSSSISRDLATLLGEWGYTHQRAVGA